MIPSLGTNAPTAACLVGPSYTRQVKHERLVNRIARLQSRAVIALRDTLTVRPGAPRSSKFDPNEVLFAAIPPRWAESPEFLALNERQMLQTSYNFFVKQSAVQSSETGNSSTEKVAPVGQHLHFQYFAVARVKSEAEPTIQGLRLKEPGRGYVHALGGVYGAAVQVLGLRAGSEKLWIDGVAIDTANASEELSSSRLSTASA